MLCGHCEETRKGKRKETRERGKEGGRNEEPLVSIECVNRVR